MPKALDDLLPYVLPDLPGVSETQAINALISSAIEFCERSLVLQRDHDPINLVAGRSAYDLDAPTGYLVHKVMKAWHRNSVLQPIAPDDMDDARLYNVHAATEGWGTPSGYTHKGERQIALWPPPNEDLEKGLTVRIAIKPKRDVTQFDDDLYQDFIEVIASGAKAKLQITPGKPFSNPQVAGFNQALFTAGVNRAMVRANKAHTRANLSVRMRRL